MLYTGQSLRFFELRPGMAWPDGALLFSKFLSNETTRLLAGILLSLAALIFIISGLGLFFQQPWSKPLSMGAALFSSLIYLLMWDAKFQALPDKGAVGLLINLAILLITLQVMPK
jgi:uncharacterized membrane protein (DUF2068 family)